ncbi:MAG: ATP-binding cassette domain-containing protein [Spirochaetia bacterium]|nr:ATP-binding cassette domain-containing protein [Spirochaetia bacterium]
MHEIELKNISLTLNGHHVLSNISETIESGSLYYLMGTAGSGKSSFLKVINGLFMEIEGEVIVNGENIYNYGQKKMLEYHKENSFVFQNSALISNMTILENLSLYYNYHTKLTKNEIIEKINPYMKLFEIEQGKLYDRPYYLSTGQRMLFGIIRALLEDCKTIFWDEPISNLDQIERNKVKKIIKEKKSQGKTIILVSNDWEFGLSVADHVGVLHNGRLIHSEAPEKIRKSKDHVIKSLISQEG